MSGLILKHINKIYPGGQQAIRDFNLEMKESGIQNILALRGDIPAESEFPIPNQYKYAYELIEDIKAVF